MVRRLRLHRLRLLLRGAVLRQERHQFNGVHLRDLRGHLRYATGGILVLRPVRRPSRPQGRPDAQHHRHVVLLLPRGGHAHPRDHRVLGGGDSGPRSPCARVRHWWRVRHISDIYVRSGNRESARLLVVVPVRHPHRRSRSRPVHTPHRAALPGYRRPQSLGMADRLLHRWRRRPCGALDSPLDGRVAQRVAPGGHPRGQGPGRGID